MPGCPGCGSSTRWSSRPASRTRTSGRWLPLPEPFRRRERALFDYPQHLTVDSLITLAGTWSYVAVRPDREDVLTRIRRLAEAQAGPGGVLVLPHRTRCYRAVRG